VRDGWVVGGCVQEGKPRFLELTHRAVDVQVQGDIKCFERVRGTGFRRDRTVATFDNLRSPSADQKRGAGGDIDGVGAVTTGAGGV